FPEFSHKGEGAESNPERTVEMPLMRGVSAVRTGWNSFATSLLERLYKSLIESNLQRFDTPVGPDVDVWVMRESIVSDLRNHLACHQGVSNLHQWFVDVYQMEYNSVGSLQFQEGGGVGAHHTRTIQLGVDVDLQDRAGTG
ncbi:MAG TPA: hypothetical protein VGE93_25920, partial [Bryobacteraceae bacterium]